MQIISAFSLLGVLGVMVRHLARVFARGFFVFVVGVFLTLSAAAQNGNVRYTYDKLGRLKTVTYVETSTRYTYTYDAAGNRTAHTIDGGILNTVRLWNTNVFEGDPLCHGIYRTGGANAETRVRIETYVPANASEYPRDFAEKVGTYNAATPGVDYLPLAAGFWVTIPASLANSGGAAASFCITTLEDSVDEPEEHIFVRIAEVVNGIADPLESTAFGRIKNDDGSQVAFHIRNSSMEEPEGYGEKMVFEVLKVGAAMQEHSVTVAFSDGTARYGLDYEGARSCDLNFAADVDLMTCEVTLLPDDIYEGGETFTAMLTNPSGGAILASTAGGQILQGQSVAIGTVRDAHDYPIVKIGQAGSKEGGAGGIPHQIWHSKNTSVPITVNYQICVTDIMVTNAECKKAGLKGVTASLDDLAVGTALSGTVVLPPSLNLDGTPTNAVHGGIITLFSRADTVEEKNEDYAVLMYQIANGAKDQDRWLAYGHIRNDDSVNSIFNIWGNEVVAGQPLTYTVRRWGNLTGSVTLTYGPGTSQSQVTSPTTGVTKSFRAGTLAVAGTDYTLPVSNAITFASNVKVQTISIPTIASTDVKLQGKKFLPIVLSGPAGVSFAVQQRLGWIKDGRTQTVTMAKGVTATEQSSKLVFPGALAHPMSVDIDMPYTTVSGGTADLDDYEAKTSVVHIPAGTTAFEIPIRIIDDTDLNGAELDETLMINVLPTAATGGTDAIEVTGTILNDLNDGCNASMRVMRRSANVDEFERGATIDLRQQGGFCTTSVALGGGVTGLAATAMTMQSGLDLSMHDYKIDLVAAKAAEGEDFVAKSVILSIPGTQQTTSIPMEIIDDLLNESTEDLAVRITPVSASDVNSGDGTLLIMDDDPGPLYSISDVTAFENNLMAFTVSKAGLTDLTSSVIYETVDGTAIAGSDYLPASGILTFAPAESQKTIVVTGIEDGTFELSEVFYVDLSQPSVGSAVEKARATATINDNDSTPSFSVSDTTATEGGALTFAVSLSQPSSLEHSVRAYTFGGGATDGEDYQAIEAALIFTPGETLQYVTVASSEDTSIEPDETFELKIADPTNGAILGDMAGQGIITDNDAPVVPNSNIVGGQIYDGAASFDGTTNSADVYKIGAGATIQFSMAGGAGGKDSGNKAGGAGGTGVFEFSGVTEFFVRLRVGKTGKDDSIYTAAQRDINGGGAGGVTGTAGQGGGATSLAISNDGFTWTPVAIVGGGGGTGNSGTTGGAGGGLNLDGLNASGSSGGKGGLVASPGAGGGGTGQGNGGAGGLPGADGARPTNTTWPQYGKLGLGNSEFGIGGGGPGGGTSVRGGGGGGGGRTGGGGGYGYSSKTGGGGGSGYFDAAAIAAITGGTPTITSTATGGNAGDGYVTLGVTGTPASPPAPAGLSFSISDVTLSEGDKFVFTVVASEPITAAVDLSYSLIDGTALATGDYTATTGTLSFAPGDAVKTIIVDTVEDAIAEGNEDFSVQLALVTGAATLAKDTGTGTILDDDEAPAFTVSTATPNVIEGQPAFITVALSHKTENDYSVNYTTVDGTALAGSGYVAASGTLTFTGGEMVKQVIIDTIDDTVLGGGGTFSLSISLPTGGATVDVAAALLTVKDSYRPSGEAIYTTPGTKSWTVPTGVTSVNVVCIGGGGGGALVRGVTWISGSGASLGWRNNITVIPGQSYTVVVGVAGTGNGGTGTGSYFKDAGTVYGGAGGTLNNTGAADGSSWGVTGASRAFVGEGGGQGGSGAWSEIGWSSLGGGGAGGYSGDGGNGAVLLTSSGSASGGNGFGGAAGGGGAASSGRGWGGAGTGLYGEGQSGLGGSGSTGATAGSAGTDAIASQNGSVYGGGAGYNMDTEGRGGNGACRIVWGDNTLFPSGVGTSTPPSGPKAVSISATSASASEGGLMYFTFSAIGYSDKEVAVSYEALSDTATSGADYTAASGTLYFAPGVTEQTIAVQTIGDTALELDETFTMQMAIVQGDADLVIPSTTGTIVNVGGELVSDFSVLASPTSVVEGGLVTVTVSRSAVSINEYGVTLATTDGTAIAGTHYSALSQVLTFAPTELSKSFTITTVDNLVLDGERAFTVNLSAPIGGVNIGLATIAVTITDNDGTKMSAAGDAAMSKVTLSNGGLTASIIGRDQAIGSDHKITSGKAYYEVTVDARGSVGALMLDPGNVNSTWFSTTWGTHVFRSYNGAAWYYSSTYDLRRGTGASTSSTVMHQMPNVSAGAIIGVYLDADAGRIYLSLNGSAKGYSFAQSVGQGYRAWTPLNASSNAGGPAVTTYNFGATPFAYPPQDGYLPFDDLAIK